MALYILTGVPGCGKSTYCNKELKDKMIVSSDAIREEFFGTRQNFSNEKKVWGTLKYRLHKALEAGKDVVLDATNTTIYARKSYIKMAEQYGTKCISIYFDVDKSVALSRNANRPKEHFVPEEVIENFYKKLQAPTLNEGFDEVIVVRD